MNKKPSDRIIYRAVELWCRKLKEPVFDNGDNSHTGLLTNILADNIIQCDKSKIDDLDERINKFKEILTKKLIALRDDDSGLFPKWLDVDYHPCKILTDSANIANIPLSLFSCKSTVNIEHDKIRASFGYAAPYVYHYPLPDGKWLITTITANNEEMQRIFENVMSDNVLGLEVEE